MRKRYGLNDGWKICAAEQADAQKLSQGIAFDGATWYDSPLPTSVQDILCRCGAIPETARNGGEDLRWIAEKDWIYVRSFSVEESPDTVRATLFLLGVDAVADIYLNGERIASHESAYLQEEIDVTELLADRNTLAILFRSPVREAEKLAAEMPPEWQGVVDTSRLLRKANSDSGTFLGNKYPCTCVGLYDEVFLEVTEKAGRIASLSVDQDLTQDLKQAELDLCAGVEGAGTVRFTVLDPDGAEVAVVDRAVENGRACAHLQIDSPALWWPRNYGPQNLYRIRAELMCDGECLDSLDRRVGFRWVSYAGNFCFRINHKRIRIYGSNIVNIEGITHWCDRERLTTLMEYARDAHYNIMRIWGEAPMMPELFYDLCDQMGILVWQDFGLGFGPWPDDQRYLDLFRAEVTQMVTRLKHHPAILIWCGSNETFMTGVSESLFNGPRIGFDLIFKVGAEVCGQLDPQRLYIPSSPMGGDYPQDARGGDIHGYWGNDYEHSLDYPVLFSESCHATTYSKHSMLRYMSEAEIWPEGYSDTHVYDPTYIDHACERAELKGRFFPLIAENYWRKLSIPDTWQGHLSSFASSELWGLEDYYDAHDADSLIYKYAACGADFYKREVERIRRGRPCRTPYDARRCNGYLTWKYNDAWPYVNFTQIDPWLEPTAQYYAVKRGYAPILAGVSADQDHLYLWAVNDSGADVKGEIVLRLFSRLRNCVDAEYRFPVWLRADESKTIECLDWLGSINREVILHTQFTGEDGEDYGSNVCYLDKERNLTFPKPRLQLAWENGKLAVRTDKYARFVELTGRSGDGEEFGWKFSDNFFDLLPFETRYISIGGRFDSGVITAKAFYGEEATQIALEGCE